MVSYLLILILIHGCSLVNVLQVLAITTTAYLLFVAFWILKMEDYLETQEEDGGKIRNDRTKT